MNLLVTAIVPILWGSTYAVVGLYLSEMSPIWVAVWRALPAGFLMLLWTRRLPPIPLKQMLILALLNVTLFFPLLMLSAFLLPGSVAGTIGATFVLQVLMFRWLLEGIKPQVNSLIAGLVGLVGIGLLLNPEANFSLVGAGAALLATALISIASVWLGRWTSEDTMGMTGWQLFLGGLLLVPVAWQAGGPLILPAGNEWLGLLWLVVLNTALAYWIWVKALKQFGASAVAPFTLLNPVTAVVLGTVLLQESLNTIQWFGIAAVFSALFINNSVLVKRLKPTWVGWKRERAVE